MIVTENGCKNIEGFENKLILNTSLIVAISALIFTCFNILFGFELILTLITILAVIVFSSIYVLGRCYKKFKIIRWLIPIIATVFVNLAWYFNYMSNGPALILFVLYYCFLILIGNNKQILVFSLIVIANLAILFIAEYHYHTNFPNYSSDKERILDVYIVVFIALAIAFSFIYYAKNNYMKQYLLAKKADELKSSFLANMSHEIRTPLNAIVGFSSLLANRNYDDEKRDKYRSYISSNSEYLLHLVNDILDISKIESNQMELVTEEFKVENLFEQLREEYSGMLVKNEKENVDVLYEVEQKDLYIRTDKYRFEQIIRNFLSNAIKFTKDGFIKFGSYIDKEKFVFYVKDTGAGISEEDLNKIFSRFTKLNNNNEDILHRGVGLGLFLSKQLASLLGGNIWAESDKGKGSTFYLSLPLSVSSR